MKKVLSLVLVLAMVLGSFSFVSAAAPDVAGTEFETAVDRLIQLGALDGYPDGTFKPGNQITREEFAAALIKTKGLKVAAEAATGLATGFNDVPATRWSSGYVGLAARLGIVNGIGNGQFAPAAPVKYEEAVTMIMRALNYTQAAEARGGYPYGYLILANEQGLLDAVKGTQGAPALRGTVAQLLDNALEVPMMVQIGFGAQELWVVSGTQNTQVRLLLDELGFDNVEGRVVSFDDSRNRITLDVEGKTRTLKVNDGFDFNYAEGLTIKAWFSNDTVVVYSAIDEAILGATDGATKIEVDGKKYAVAKDAYLELNGEEVEAVKFTADYAKVVLNDENEIVWAKGYELPYLLVVKEVKDEVAYDFDKDEVDLKNYTVLKDGKTLELDDLEELDLLFFNKSEKFAIVYNEGKEGEIERVYTTEFKFAGKVYPIHTADYESKYLDGKDFGKLTELVLADMRAEEEEVKVFFNTRDKAVFVVGNRGKAATSSFYGVVTENSRWWTGRGGSMWSLDVMNEEAKDVSYDITEKFVKDGKLIDTNNKAITSLSIDNANPTIKEDMIVRVTADTDGKLTKVEILPIVTINAFDIDASFAEKADKSSKYRLQSSTLVFYGDKVVKLGDAEGVFSTVEANADAYISDGRVVLVSGSTNADKGTTEYKGLVKNVRVLRNGAYEYTIEVFGETKVFTTSTSPAADAKDTDLEGEMGTITVGKKSEVVTKVEKLEAGGKNIKVVDRNTSNRTINDVYELNAKAVVYDKDEKGNFKKISLRDLKANDIVQLYFEVAGNSRFVDYVVRTDDYEEEDGGKTGASFELAFVARSNTWVTIGGKDYLYGGEKTIEQLNGFKGKDVTFVTKTIDGELVVVDIKTVD